MEVKKYWRRGTPDLPVATYIGIAGAKMEKWSKEARCHSEIEIMLIVKGSIRIRIGQTKNTFYAGDFFIIPGNVIHQRVAHSADALVHEIVFHTDALRMHPTHYFQKNFVQPLSEGRLELPLLLQPGHPAYEAVYEQMMGLESCRIYEKDFKQHRLSALMNICLALMPYSRVISDEPPLPDPGHEGVKLCMRYLHNHHTKKISIPEVAGFCHLHPNYLSTVFRRYTGVSIVEYLTRIRIESAQRLLKEDLPVSKVAELSGFHSECLLYKKFKEHTGMTPKAYQQQKKNQAE